MCGFVEINNILTAYSANIHHKKKGEKYYEKNFNSTLVIDFGH